MIATPNKASRGPSNNELAERLDVQADHIAERDDNPYHVLAYRRAAEMLRRLEQPAAEIFHRNGRAGLEQLPTIGKSLARRIERLIQEQDAETEAERLFTTVAEIGPELAKRIHEQFGIQTLAQLYSAACDGRLAQVPGIGAKRLRGIREALASRVGEVSRAAKPRGRMQWPQALPREDEPPVELLLEIDRQYRESAAENRLPKIAPKRFNPTGAAWLPILHTSQKGERFTALFSNTARAHELNATKDWVVIYREHPRRGQWTVVTGQLGSLHGRRLVRGREKECVEFYAHAGDHDAADSPS
jgi:Holliday junction resolvasome RuvABC DNA-binding subunit